MILLFRYQFPPGVRNNSTRVRIGADMTQRQHKHFTFSWSVTHCPTPTLNPSLTPRPKVALLRSYGKGWTMGTHTFDRFATPPLQTSAHGGTVLGQRFVINGPLIKVRGGRYSDLHKEYTIYAQRYKFYIRNAEIRRELAWLFTY